jgi:hypothetical protein
MNGEIAAIANSHADKSMFDRRSKAMIFSLAQTPNQKSPA